MSDKRDTFHEVTIAGIPLRASMSIDGPYLQVVRPPNSPFRNVGVPIGAIIIGTGPDGHPWVCKHDPNQLRFGLPSFSDTDFEQLVQEFGVSPRHDGILGGFFQSKAWVGLKEWTRKHPRIAKHADKAGCLGDWYSRAIEENAAEATKPVAV